MKRIAFLALGALVLASCQTANGPEIVDGEVEVVEEVIESEYSQYDYSAELKDVTKGEAFGMAYSVSDHKGFRLSAELSNLPPLEEGYFYEGWVVRATPFSVISTGVADPIKKAEGEFLNDFSIEENLTDHTKYILTLEPDDGDPAPADHVLEGELTLID